MICRVCDSNRLELVLDLGNQPRGNLFLTKEELGKEPHYPLRLLFCMDCTTSQLDYTVPKETMFTNHTYLSGITRSLAQHFKEVALEVDKAFFSEQKQKKVLDIGSNDGTQLRQFQDLNYEVLGVDPSSGTVEIALQNGVPTEHAFFNLEFAKNLNQKFDVINAAGVFFHLEELHSVTDGIRECLKKNGVFVIQFIYMKGMIQNVAVDQIYHEHLVYYTLKNVQTLLNRHGLELFDARFSPIHGGSIIAFVGHPGVREKSGRLKDLEEEEEKTNLNQIDTYFRFAERAGKMRTENLRYLDEAHAKGKRVYGMGAPVKGNTLLNYFGVNTSRIEYLIEKNPLRKGLYSPMSHIPILLEEDVKTPPDIYYVLAWNFKKEILSNNQNLIDQGVEFYFPVNP